MSVVPLLPGMILVFADYLMLIATPSSEMWPVKPNDVVFGQWLDLDYIQMMTDELMDESFLLSDPSACIAPGTYQKNGNILEVQFFTSLLKLLWICLPSWKKNKCCKLAICEVSITWRNVLPFLFDPWCVLNWSLNALNIYNLM